MRRCVFGHLCHYLHFLFASCPGKPPPMHDAVFPASHAPPRIRAQGRVGWNASHCHTPVFNSHCVRAGAHHRYCPNDGFPRIFSPPYYYRYYPRRRVCLQTRHTHINPQHIFPSRAQWEAATIGRRAIAPEPPNYPKIILKNMRAEPAGRQCRCLCPPVFERSVTGHHPWPRPCRAIFL